jgi:hypothetical protein
MNEKTESNSARDGRRLRDDELDAIAGGMPGLGTMVYSMVCDAVNSAINQLAREAGLPR